MNNIVTKMLALCGLGIDQSKRKLADSRLMAGPTQQRMLAQQRREREADDLIQLSGAPAGYSEPEPQK